jgi:hypothetical protein
VAFGQTKLAKSGGKLLATRRKGDSEKPKRPPATTPEARENQLIAAAVELAEKQLQEGTASAQVITHYLKLGTTRERLEQEKLRRENELLKAKSESLASAARVEELYSNALKAMRTYAGNAEDDGFEG